MSSFMLFRQSCLTEVVKAASVMFLCLASCSHSPSAVIKMEGGTDHDLLSLETPATGWEEDMKIESKDEGKQTENSQGMCTVLHTHISLCLQYCCCCL